MKSALVSTLFSVIILHCHKFSAAVSNMGKRQKIKCISINILAVFLKLILGAVLSFTSPINFFQDAILPFVMCLEFG